MIRNIIPGSIAIFFLLTFLLKKLKIVKIIGFKLDFKKFTVVVNELMASLLSLSWCFQKLISDKDDKVSCISSQGKPWGFQCCCLLLSVTEDLSASMKWHQLLKPSSSSILFQLEIDKIGNIHGWKFGVQEDGRSNIPCKMDPPSFLFFLFCGTIIAF